MVKDKQVELIKIVGGLRVDEILKKYPNHIIVVKRVWGDTYLAIFTMRDKTAEEIELEQAKEFQRLKNSVTHKAWKAIKVKISKGESHPDESEVIYKFENVKTHEDKVRLLNEYNQEA